ncbi:hypothetical protein IKG33_01735 [Candidatus Saccharibacteria bacterium]|nr:hypothetical protein [Candidatus Saccharibacteria bacterium]
MLSVCKTEGERVIPRSNRGFIEKKILKNGYDLEDLAFFQRLETDFPEFRFLLGDKFKFRPPKTIVIGPPEAFSRLLTLHEVSHAILKHKGFRMDVTRLKMENAAWEKAKELASKYGIEVNEELIQDELDTYRDWLHQKSRCPKCGLTRFQTPDSRYHCPRCDEFS